MFADVWIKEKWEIKDLSNKERLKDESSQYLLSKLTVKKFKKEIVYSKLKY
jgi:hypothetical protein